MFLSFIKTRYSDSDFITQKKALYLFVFCTILVVMVPIIFIVSTVTSPELLGQNIAGMLPIFLTNIIAMFLIARGRNTIAGYLFGTVIAAAVFFLVLTNPRGQSFYDTFFYVLGFTILAMLFTNRVMTALFVLSFIIGAVLYYFIMRDGASLSRPDQFHHSAGADLRPGDAHVQHAEQRDQEGAGRVRGKPPPS